MTDKPITQEQYDAQFDELLQGLASLAVSHPHFGGLYDKAAVLRRARVVVVPEGHHVYTSPWKIGEKVWIARGTTIHGKPMTDECEVLGVSETGLWLEDFDYYQHEQHRPFGDCFPTREEAEAECARRNKGGDRR
jgi:hypothetical protein